MTVFKMSQYKLMPEMPRGITKESTTKGAIMQISKRYPNNNDLANRVKKVIESVSGLTWDKISSKGRKIEIVAYRQIFCKIMKDVKGNTITLKEVAAMVRPGLDHATVLHSIRHIENLIQTELETRERYKQIIELI